MKTHRKQQRKINSIATGRWTAYAAAAAASGFAATHTAEATIHYSGLVNQKIRGGDRAIFHLDPGGGTFVAYHFNFFAGSSSFSAGGKAGLAVYGAESASVNGVSNMCKKNVVCVSNLDRGNGISARPFAPKNGVLAQDFFNGSWSSFGNFQHRGLGLVGFKFNNGAGDQYGWVRVKMLDGRRNMFSVVDYAYGDPGDVVLAGQKSDDSAPSLESLGGLALGAAGLLAWRGRRPALVP